MNEENACLFFSLAPAIGAKRYRELLRIYKSAQASYEACMQNYPDAKRACGGERASLRIMHFAKTCDIVSYTKLLEIKNIQFIPSHNPNFPSSLFDLSDPPIGIFIRGNIQALQNKNPKLAIVGTRKVTEYGRQITQEFTSKLATSGFTIISGLALGVDSIAHSATISTGGITIAVLGCGVDCCYPHENKFLYKSILDNNGLVISEYPLTSHPTKGTFLMRNRIIASLADGVLVPEAGSDSGALVTAKAAQGMKRPVFAIPGSIHSSLSVGTIQLLKNGAHIVSESADILSFYGKKYSSVKKDLPPLTEQEKKIVDILQHEEKEIQDISSLLNLSVQTVLMYLSQLEMKGVVKNNGGIFRFNH